MQLQNNTIILAAIHVAIIGVGGVAAGITSSSSGGAAMTPPWLVARFR
jgi:hypothetical protein